MCKFFIVIDDKWNTKIQILYSCIIWSGWDTQKPLDAEFS